jgi:predicted Zn-dependent peptidase
MTFSAPRPGAAILLALVAASIIGLMPATAAAIDLRDARVTRLDNGMTVILLENRSFPAVSLQMLYRVGTRDETAGLTGLAHFLEHMAFRETENFPDTEVVSSIYRHGGEWHGYTWIDQTTYFETMPKEQLDLALRIHADRMGRLVISRDDMEAERGAVLAEMHSYENDPATVLLDAVLFASFLGHPYRNNTIGFESDIEHLGHADVVAFYRRHYHPANAVLAVVGDFDGDTVMKRIEALFGGYPAREPTPLPHTVEPARNGERRVTLYGDAPGKLFKIAWRAPAATSPDYAPFLVLQELLGGGSGVNFSQNDWGTPAQSGSALAGAADDVTTWFTPSAQDYVFIVGGSAAADADEGRIEKELETRIAALRQEAPARAALERAKARVLDELVFDVETTEDAAHQLAFFDGLGAFDVLLALPELVAGVTPDDVHRVAGSYLQPRQRTIGWWVPGERGAPRVRDGRVVIPPSDMPAEPSQGAPVPPPIVAELKNGLPVILQQSDFSASAYLGVVLPATALDLPGATANVPVTGYTSLAYRLRPDGLRNAITESGDAVAAARTGAGAVVSSRDPGTRLEQAFAELMTGRARADAGQPVAPALIVVSGAMDPPQVLADLDRGFGAGSMQRARFGEPRAIEAGESNISMGQPVAQAQLGYIVAAPGPAEDASYAYRILLYILSHAYEGRFGKEAISNRGLAYYADSRYRSDGHSGWVTIAVGVDPAKLGALKALLADELARLRSSPPTDAEIGEAKSHLLGRARSAAQSNEELSAALARQWLWYGKVQSPDELAEHLARVSRQDVIDHLPAFTAGLTIVVAE